MINLEPHTEAKLKALAQTAGLSIDEFLLSLVSDAPQRVLSQGESKPARAHDPLAEFQTWVKKFSTQGPGLSDEAVSRDSIYER